MTIAQSVLHSIHCLEETLQKRWVTRALILCPDEAECSQAVRILTSLDHSVEMILYKDLETDRPIYYTSIERLRKGLSRVLVTTAEVLSIIQKLQDDPLYFDIIL